MANIKEYIGTCKTNNVIQNWCSYKMTVDEISTDISKRTSTIRISTYLKFTTSGSIFSDNISTTFRITGKNNYTNNKYVNYGYNDIRYKYCLLESYDVEVSNTGTKSSPTVINISTTTTTSAAVPNLMEASGTFTLTALSEPPVITNVSFTEDSDSPVKSLNIDNDIFVPYLSKKTAVITTETKTYPAVRFEVSGSNYKFESSNNNVKLNFKDIAIPYDGSNFQTTIKVLAEDQYGLGTIATINKTVIPYFTPNLEPSNSNVRRKTDSQTNLIDSKATLSVKGTFYKGNDNVGNNNSITVEYKVWKDGESEPTDYTRLITGISISGNNIEATKILDNIDYLSKYHYKIKINDNYNYVSETIGDVPTGIAVWTEYKDRVDFAKITVQNYNPFEYSENETICGVWLGKPLYRKVIDFTTGNTAGEVDIEHNISNVERFITIEGFTFGTNQRFLPNFYRDMANQYGLLVYWASKTTVCITYGSSRTNLSGKLILEYTKTTDKFAKNSKN